MKWKKFAKYLARDLHCPCGCPGKEDTYVPQHRANRGMGGGKDRPSNIIVLCSWMNGQIESSAILAAQAREYGWKLESWEYPEEAPFFDLTNHTWFRIDDDFGRVAVSQPYGAVIT